VAKALPLQVGAALLASAEGYTPRANGYLDHAREELGSIVEIANGLADNLPAPKAPARKSRRRRKKRRSGAPAEASGPEASAAGVGPSAERSSTTETAAKPASPPSVDQVEPLAEDAA
jgi:hypothetical protein